MKVLKSICPSVGINYLALVTGYLILKFVVGASVVFLLAIAVGASFSSFWFVKKNKRYMSKLEASVATFLNGVILFYIIALQGGEAFNEPYTGVLLRVAVVLMGAMVGFGFYAFLYFSRNIWREYIESA